MHPPLDLSPALAQLAELPRWVVWKWVTGKNGRRTKPPFQGHAPGKHASSTDARTWCGLTTAMQAYRAGKADGVGFVLSPGGIAAFDIDHCRDPATGSVHPWAQDLIRRCNSYAEVTPSGTGVRVIGTANGPALHRKLPVPGANGATVEIYRKADRYITITGVEIGKAVRLASIDGQADALVAKLGGGNVHADNIHADNGDNASNGHDADGPEWHDLDCLIRDGCGQNFGGDRSRALWYAIHQLLRRGDDPEDIVATILDRRNRISDHVYDQAKSETYARRQVEKARHQAKTSYSTGAQTGKPRPAKDVLIALAKDAELFHTADGTAYGDIQVHGHRETWPIRAKGFRRWLGRCYYQETQSAPNAEAMQAALGIIEARAHYDAPERAIATRVGGLDGRLYIDLCNAGWQAIEVDEDGWRIVDDPPVRFRRANGMMPLPLPEGGGDIATLRKYLNLTATGETTADSKFVLAVSVLLAYMRPTGPFPVLVLAGEQGAAKSTFAAVLRALIDPNASALRALPREDRDLFIAATNSWLLAFDNVSTLPDWISDTLCRLATGGGFSTRQLYSDSDEALFSAMRPVMLNGIEDFVGRPDLADRSVFLMLEPITEESRQSEDTFWAAFESERPRILGALFDTVARGLKNLPDVRLERTPRMADFARWGAACEWTAGAFMAAYDSNRQGAVETVLEADLVPVMLRAFMANKQSKWVGNATELLAALTDDAGETVSKAKEWPKTPKTLSGRLRRAAPFLRKIGIRVSFERNKVGRTIAVEIDR